MVYEDLQVHVDLQKEIDEEQEMLDFLEKKYQILIVTGNGFDLACGLPTRYVDFFNAYVIPYILNSKGQSFYSDTQKFKNAKNIVSSLAKARDFSFWEYYLAYCDSLDSELKRDGKLWFDIEKEIEDSLNRGGFWDKIKENYNKGKKEINYFIFKSRNKNKKLQTIIQNSFYLKYKEQIFDKENKFVSTEFYKCLLKELEVLEGHFRLYLESLYDKHYDYEKVKKKNLDEIEKVARSLHDNLAKKVRYLSFNYTNFNRSEYGDDPTICVHGDRYPIIGIGDLRNVDSDLDMFSKMSRRDQQHLKDYRDIIGSQNYYLVFYGLSFSEMDFEEYKYLIDNNECHGVLALYSEHDESDEKEKTKQNLMKLFHEIFDWDTATFWSNKENSLIRIEEIKLEYKVKKDEQNY